MCFTIKTLSHMTDSQLSIANIKVPFVCSYHPSVWRLPLYPSIEITLHYEEHENRSENPAGFC